MKHQQQLRRRLVAVVATVLVALPGVAAAAGQNYGVLNEAAQDGMIVSQTANSGVVDLTTSQTAGQMLGVIAPASVNGTTLTAPAGQVNVENDGQVSTLVSTLGGDVRVGDRIAPSALAGVGAKAKGNGWIVGIAQGSLDSKTGGAVETSVSDSKGGKHTVFVGRVPVILHITYYSMPGSTASSSTALPGSIQTIADKIAGKHASLLGLILSFVLLLTGIIWAGQLLHAAISGSLSAIARQPLSKLVVNRALAQTLAVALVIVVGVLLGAFLLIRIL